MTRPHTPYETALSIHQAMTPWSTRPYRSEPDGTQFYLDLPLICVDTSEDVDWRFDRQEQKQTWIFFQDRQSWRQAHRLARMLARQPRGLQVSYAEVASIPSITMAPRHQFFLSGCVVVPDGTGGISLFGVAVKMGVPAPRRQRRGRA